jgi:hypothetical protein
MLDNLSSKLTIIKETEPYISPSGFKAKKVLCQCECGTVKVIRKQDVLNGHTKSCGCLQKEIMKKSKTTHNISRTPLYTIWNSIYSRCTNKNNLQNEYQIQKIT